MADRTIKILTPATEFAFMTLDEMKTFFGEATGVASATDDQLQMFIDFNSTTIMRLCNRIMAREEVQETWRDLQSRRVFLSHWPVKEADIESVFSGSTELFPGDYELEEDSGKLSNFAGWVEDIVVTYWGGYNLPDEAPPPHKQATSLMVRDAKMQGQMAVAAGVRSIGYRGKRVMFFDPLKLMQTGGAGAGIGVNNPAVRSLLVHYTRWEV